MDPTDLLTGAARAWVARYHPELAATEVSVTLTDGRRASLPVPSAPPSDWAGGTAGGADEGADLTPCEADIIAIIDAGGKRLTTEGVLRALQGAEKLHGDSTVVKALARLTKAWKLLNNERDGYGRGYGLADWSNAAGRTTP